ncbi:signal transduction histidine kinase [Cytobacillus horneckiae]|uniref:Oxygen sensor histidine kinase NreB n=1 Tax=Cytobacillus horneckiae TaxID=549687 RepID=A0A2N0ZFK4_9BACI|nr:sensor histidine kinase [Cytobacillus horneckiae]MBN6885172.1 sensor histidine kinase [Cytobacillus horneckiae]MCM3179076.1 sensor histidine kinase [Cytobacillus horneckiae]MEC1154300.1 sensor histidine kinase [Cytobacillus horneckiae]MED2937636.1 sensor histidine kinase [Cytobacillus horneckiae]PKG28286.1 sensor histidine kinase [Cytobacillus horneckiae]
MTTQPENQKVSSYIIQSQEQEIKRIALELHEGVGQSLYSLFTGLQFIEKAVKEPEMKSYMGNMTNIMEKTIQEIRLLSVELHPPTLTTLGIVPAVKSYLKLYTSTYGIEVTVDHCGDEVPLTERENIALFRVCQEALVNIARYADTSSASVIFIWDKDLLSITIKDSGKGFDVEAGMEKSCGLAAMKERMKLIGGKCSIASNTGEGTAIEVLLPL